MSTINPKLAAIRRCLASGELDKLRHIAPAFDRIQITSVVPGDTLVTVGPSFRHEGFIKPCWYEIVSSLDNPNQGVLILTWKVLPIGGSPMARILVISGSDYNSEMTAYTREDAWCIYPTAPCRFSSKIVTLGCIEVEPMVVEVDLQ